MKHGGDKRRETTGILARGEREVGGEMTRSEAPKACMVHNIAQLKH